MRSRNNASATGGAAGTPLPRGYPLIRAAAAEGLPASPRAAVLATLAGELARLSAAGNLEGARILNETIGRLLGSATPGAPVVDLGAERARRGLSLGSRIPRQGLPSAGRPI
jgi:hypothetical protein